MLASLGHYLGLLRQADFRRLWLSMSVSTLGSEVTFLALPLVAILMLEATPVEVAVLGAMPFVAFRDVRAACRSLGRSPAAQAGDGCV